MLTCLGYRCPSVIHPFFLLSLSLHHCSGRKEDPSTRITQASAPTHCTKTGQTYPFHDEPFLPNDNHGSCAGQAALCGVSTEQLSPDLPSFQHSEPTQCQASEPIFSESSHPTDSHHTTDAPDSCYPQPNPSTCQAPSLIYWGCVSG